MNNSSNNRQSKPDPKPEAITSVILGIISIVADLIIIVPVYFGRSIFYWDLTVLYPFFWGWSFAGWLFVMAGIALGIMGLKSIKRKWAITGIILLLIGLVAYIYAFIYGFTSL